MTAPAAAPSAWPEAQSRCPRPDAAIAAVAETFRERLSCGIASWACTKGLHALDDPRVEAHFYNHCPRHRSGPAELTLYVHGASSLLWHCTRCRQPDVRDAVAKLQVGRLEEQRA